MTSSVIPEFFMQDKHPDPGPNRTADLLLRRQPLYPLSYRTLSYIYLLTASLSTLQKAMGTMKFFSANIGATPILAESPIQDGLIVIPVPFI